MSPVHAVVRGSVLEVTLDRPKANAIDAATSRLLGETFTRLRDDDALRAGVITGAGDRFFSAGWDLKAAAGGEEYEADYGPGGFGGFPELPGLHKPVIAAVNGMAVGGGFEIVLAADLVVAAEHAGFWLPETGLGLVPDAATVRLPRLLPGPIATEMLIAERRMDAAEALRWGLVNAVVPAADVMTAARELADRIAAAAPLAVHAVLEAARETGQLGIEEAFDRLRALPSYRRAIDSEDAGEGPKAFAEKRAPRWKGR